jgi:hypothetical protein
MDCFASLAKRGKRPPLLNSLLGVAAPRGSAGQGCLIFMDRYRSNNGADCSAF